MDGFGLGVGEEAAPMNLSSYTQANNVHPIESANHKQHHNGQQQQQQQPQQHGFHIQVYMYKLFQINELYI